MAGCGACRGAEGAELEVDNAGLSARLWLFMPPREDRNDHKIQSGTIPFAEMPG